MCQTLYDSHPANLWYKCKRSTAGLFGHGLGLSHWLRTSLPMRGAKGAGLDIGRATPGLISAGCRSRDLCITACGRCCMTGMRSTACRRCSCTAPARGGAPKGGGGELSQRRCPWAGCGMPRPGARRAPCKSISGTCSGIQAAPQQHPPSRTTGRCGVTGPGGACKHAGEMGRGAEVTVPLHPPGTAEA